MVSVFHLLSCHIISVFAFFSTSCTRPINSILQSLPLKPDFVITAPISSPDTHFSKTLACTCFPFLSRSLLLSSLISPLLLSVPLSSSFLSLCFLLLHFNISAHFMLEMMYVPIDLGDQRAECSCFFSTDSWKLVLIRALMSLLLSNT